MVKYWIAKHPTMDWQFKVYEESALDAMRSQHYLISEVTSAGPLIRLWTATNDHGDGSSSAKIFTSEAEATKWAENNEYFPEVSSVVIDVELFEKVGKYT